MPKSIGKATTRQGLKLYNTNIKNVNINTCDIEIYKNKLLTSLVQIGTVTDMLYIKLTIWLQNDIFDIVMLLHGLYGH